MIIMESSLYKGFIHLMKKINRKLKYQLGLENMMKQKKFIELLTGKI